MNKMCCIGVSIGSGIVGFALARLIALAALSLAFAACTNEGAGSMNASGVEETPVAECDSTTKLPDEKYCRDGKIMTIYDEDCAMGRDRCVLAVPTDTLRSLVKVYCGDTVLVTRYAQRCNLD